MKHHDNCDCWSCNLTQDEKNDLVREEFNRAESNYMRSYAASISRKIETDMRCYVELNYQRIMVKLNYSEEQARKLAEDEYIFSL